MEVGSTKLIGHLHWALFIVIQISFFFWFICLHVYRNLILTISAQMKTSANWRYIYITNDLALIFTFLYYIKNAGKDILKKKKKCYNFDNVILVKEF